MEALFLQTADDALSHVADDSDPDSDRASRFASLYTVVADISEHHRTKYSATATASDWFRLSQSARNVRDTVVTVNAATGGDPTQVATATDAVDDLVDELDLIRELARHLESVRGRPGSVSEDLAALKRFRREVRSAFEQVLQQLAALAVG